PFDPNAVLKRCSGKADLAAIVLEKFQKQALDAIAQIEQSVAARDAERLARVSHAIKGTAGLVSAEQLRIAAARLEELARNSQIELAEESVKKVRQEVERCCAQVAEVRTDLNRNRDAGESAAGASPAVAKR